MGRSAPAEWRAPPPGDDRGRRHRSAAREAARDGYGAPRAPDRAREHQPARSGSGRSAPTISTLTLTSVGTPRLSGTADTGSPSPASNVPGGNGAGDAADASQPSSATGPTGADHSTSGSVAVAPPAGSRPGGAAARPVPDRRIASWCGQTSSTVPLDRHRPHRTGRLIWAHGEGATVNCRPIPTTRPTCRSTERATWPSQRSGRLHRPGWVDPPLHLRPDRNRRAVLVHLWRGGGAHEDPGRTRIVAGVLAAGR